jgi:hypothetical protein
VRAARELSPRKKRKAASAIIPGAAIRGIAAGSDEKKQSALSTYDQPKERAKLSSTGPTTRTFRLTIDMVLLSLFHVLLTTPLPDFPYMFYRIEELEHRKKRPAHSIAKVDPTVQPQEQRFGHRD